MRTLNPSFALASLVGFLAAVSCTLITDVDRTKIPTDAGAEGGSPGTGGTAGTGGTIATGGTGGSTGGTSMGGEAGQTPGSGGSTGATGGKGGSSGTGGNTGGKGGTGGSPATEVCAQATGSITLKPNTLFADGDTITLNDGVNPALVFEMDLDTKPGVASGNQAIAFNGRENHYGLAALIRDAIRSAHTDGTLRINATTSFTYEDSGAAGGGGAPGAAGTNNGNGGEGGAVDLTIPAVIDLTNDLAGARGNQRIKTTAGNPNFSVSGMGNGKAVACTQPASCNADSECGSGSCGDDHVCQ